MRIFDQLEVVILTTPGLTLSGHIGKPICPRIQAVEQVERR